MQTTQTLQTGSPANSRATICQELNFLRCKEKESTRSFHSTAHPSPFYISTMSTDPKIQYVTLFQVSLHYDSLASSLHISLSVSALLTWFTETCSTSLRASSRMSSSLLLSFYPISSTLHILSMFICHMIDSILTHLIRSHPLIPFPPSIIHHITDNQQQ